LKIPCPNEIFLNISKDLKRFYFTKFCFFFGGEKVVFENFNISTNEFRTRIVEYDEVAGD
jgi:hypothetical protein